MSNRLSEPEGRRRVTRRQFMHATAAVAAGAALARPRMVRAAPVADKINVAFIGVRGKGKADLDGVSRAGGNVVALCDVDARNLAAAAKEHPGATQHRDFRKMLEGQKDIDAVVVTTPDHCHAAAALMAMKLGKHVYCQKPLTHDLYEARVLTEAARKYKVATQMGNQGHASEGLRQQVDWVKGGLIGAVREAHIWTNRPIWPQGVHRPGDDPPVPPSLDWDLWIGPAPYRPFNPAYHPFKWRGFFDFGTGALGDMACHIMDAAFWSLDLSGPCTIEAEQEGLTEDSYPKWSVITYQFPQRGDLPPVKVTWYDGGKLPEKPEGLSDKVWKKTKDGATLFVGEKGKIFGAYTSNPVLLDDKGAEVDAREVKAPEPKLPRSPGHYVEWVNACRGGPAAMSNFDYAGPLTETVLLGNLAVRLGRKIEWDPKELKVKGVPEADALIRREYRKGWELL